MAVIQPGLFMVIERFPEQRNRASRLYASSESFRSLCTSYQECTTAQRFWGKLKTEEAHERHREYLRLRHELEEEILQFYSESQIEKS